MFPAVPLSCIKPIKLLYMPDKSCTASNIQSAKVSLFLSLFIFISRNISSLFFLGLIVKLSSELTNFQADPTFFSSAKNETNFCSVPLPPPLPIAPNTSPVAQRLFIVCTPHVLPLHVLKKVFCRFGYLIDVYLLNNRNCGYVKYAKSESAKQVRRL